MSDLKELDLMWNGEVAEGFKHLAPGIYRGEISDYKLCQTGKNATWALIALIDLMLPESAIGTQVEKCWWLTEKSMPYVARDLKEIECGLFKDSPVSEQLQKLPLVGKSVDFKYDIAKGEEYPKVQWLKLSCNSAVAPQGAAGLKKPGAPAAISEKKDIPF